MNCDDETYVRTYIYIIYQNQINRNIRTKIMYEEFDFKMQEKIFKLSRREQNRRIVLFDYL